jgi:hypothetical protein
MIVINIEIVKAYLPFFIGLLILQYTLQILALIDLTNHENIRGKKWVWILVIVLTECLGPILYFLFGKKKA